MLQGVIFDMDGVIVDSMPVYAKAWNTVAREYSIPFDFMSEIHHFNGMSEIKGIEYLLNKTNKPISVEQFLEKKNAILSKSFEKEVRLMPDFLDFHTMLKQNSIKTALASSARMPTIQIVLKKFKLTFDFVISGRDLKESKPHPEIFQKSQEALNVLPKYAVVLEDAPAGITAAHRAGIKAIALTTTESRDNLKEADLIIANYGELSLDAINTVLKPKNI